MKKLILLVLILQNVVCFSQKKYVYYPSISHPGTYWMEEVKDNKLDNSKKETIVATPIYNPSIAPSDANYLNLVNSLTAPLPRQTTNNTIINVNIVQPNLGYNSFYNSAMQPVYNPPMWQSNTASPISLTPAKPMKIT